MEYKKKDIKKISWKDFNKNIDKIKKEVQAYIQEQNLNIDVIVPILRGGGIPALKLAYEFGVVRILPYQFKYVCHGKVTKSKKMLKSSFSQLRGFKLKSPTILVVEGNHSTGNLANKIVSDIKKQIPGSKIIYVALAKDYKYKDSVKEAIFTTCGFFTNENRELSKKECKKLKIKFDKVYILPWESYEEELSALNGQKFNYMNEL